MITISGGTPVVIIENGVERELMYNLPDEGGIVPTGSQTFTENGTYDVTAIAEAIVNVAGTGGLEYETATYTPDADISQPIIEFSKTHSNRPFCIIFQDVTSGVAPLYSGLCWLVMSWYDFTGSGYDTSSEGETQYAKVTYVCTSTAATGVSSSTSTITSLTSSQSNNGMPYHLTNTAFMPFCGSFSRYWRQGHTYKWIAVWKPETNE